MTTLAIPRWNTGSGVRERIRSLVRGRADDAAWVRPAQLAVTLLAATVNLANLTLNGYANTYYAAAALAGSQSWSAWFFGSIDAANFITVDKPPLSTMVMGLSVRLFGLSPASVLVPEALMGVATVVLLYLAVRRTFGPLAATIAAVVLSLTPVGALMFRFNNPDALLTLLLVGAAYALVRTLEAGRLRWLVGAALLVGLAFNTKYLQAYLVVPAFVVTYLVAAPVSLRRRAGALAAAAIALVVSSGWWVAAVQLIPASARPYIGGSTGNSALDLVLGYDGLARIFGGGSAGPGGGGNPTFAGAAGLLRLFNVQLGGQVSWLLPFALLACAAGIALRIRAPRTDARRSGYLLWGLWLAVTGLVFSLMSGTIHPYYAVALAPAIAALVGAGLVDLGVLHARHRVGGPVLAAGIVLTAWWSWQLLGRSPTFVPGLGLATVAAGAVAGLLLSLPIARGRRRLGVVAAGLGLAVMLAGPAAYTLETITTAKSGADPSAGPAVAVAADDRGGFGAGMPGAGAGGPGAGGPTVSTTAGQPPAMPSALAGDAPGMPGADGQNGSMPPSAGGGPAGGADSALVDYLTAHRGSATWIVAVDSSNQAASIELATGLPVMGMGGFTGSDPAPTLAQLQAYVASGQVRYVIVGGAGGGPGGGNATISAIDAWVTSVGTVVDYGGSGSTLYDLSGVTATGS